MSSYLEARKAFGLSREKLSNLAKLAGIVISPTSIKKLEDEGEKAVGSRGISTEAVAYIDYVLGLGSAEPTNWAAVEKGAPVIVSGEKGTFSFHSVNDNGDVTVFSDKFRSFTPDRVRLIATSSTPDASNAHLFETRTRGDGGVYARQVMSYVSSHAGTSHSVGAIAYDLGLDNGVVSRTVAGLIKSGKLSKVSRGVVTLADSGSAPAANEAGLSDAQWEASAGTEEAADEIPQF